MLEALLEFIGRLVAGLISSVLYQVFLPNWLKLLLIASCFAFLAAIAAALVVVSITSDGGFVRWAALAAFVICLLGICSWPWLRRKPGDDHGPRV